MLPWVLVVVVAAASTQTVRDWLDRSGLGDFSLGDRRGRFSRTAEQTDFNAVWKSHRLARHPARVFSTIDGDTFDARVVVSPGVEITTRIRLRGIDAPEMKAACTEEREMAEAAANALRQLLDERDVSIFNVGPDKYGRVVADVATTRTPNVSMALLKAGHVRRYDGGHRDGWCPAPSGFSFFRW